MRFSPRTFAQLGRCCRQLSRGKFIRSLQTDKGSMQSKQQQLYEVHKTRAVFKSNVITRGHGENYGIAQLRFVSNDVKTQSRNYFEILGVETSYNVSLDDVKERYKKLMGRFHPDVSAGLVSDEAEEGQQDAPFQKMDEQKQATVVTDITEAYEVLKNPYRRALHRLEITGHPIEEGDNMASVIGPEFLGDIMDTRQDVEAAKDDIERKELMKQNTLRMEKTTKAIMEAFEQGQYSKAQQLTAELRYWTRIDEQLREDIEEL